MTIPDDIMKTAKDIVYDSSRYDSEGYFTKEDMIESFASALLAERERCARVASPNHGRGIFDQYENGRRDAAAAIRKGDTA